MHCQPSMNRAIRSPPVCQARYTLPLPDDLDVDHTFGQLPRISHAPTPQEARAPASRAHAIRPACPRHCDDARTSHRLLRSEEHTSELQSLMRISYAVFCLKKKKTTTNKNITQEQTNTR